MLVSACIQHEAGIHGAVGTTSAAITNGSLTAVQSHYSTVGFGSGFSERNKQASSLVEFCRKYFATELQPMALKDSNRWLQGFSTRHNMYGAQ